MEETDRRFIYMQTYNNYYYFCFLCVKMNQLLSPQNISGVAEQDRLQATHRQCHISEETQSTDANQLDS